MNQVNAVITADSDKRNGIHSHFCTRVPADHAGRGFVEYGAAVDADNALPFQTRYDLDTSLGAEKRESMGAHNAHAVAPRMVAFEAKSK